jgi:hypothetical protein
MSMTGVHPPAPAETELGRFRRGWGARRLLVVAGVVGVPVVGVTGMVAEAPPALLTQSVAAAEAKSAGCLSCHGGIEPMHESAAVRLGCTDCHGGDPGPAAPAGAAPGDAGYEEAKRAAHVAPRHPERWPTSANPERTYTALLEEPAELVRFINPGDLRVAAETCGPCHPEQANAVPKSPMTTSSIFWAAAAYANGIVGSKIAFLGESYGRDGEARRISGDGAVPYLLPLPRWEITQPGEYFRAFERGGILNPSFPPEIGNPNPRLPDDPGRPDIRFSNRGPGTGTRISPALINLHKTRLNDPHLSFLGTNDHPGDYRSSGCTACHVVYANDRDPAHSGAYAAFGHRGRSASGDPAIPKDEPGHPIRHRLTRAIPTSQCIVCHMHQPNSFVNTYLGYQMWDYETDGELLWPGGSADQISSADQIGARPDPTPAERRASLEHNPEGAAVRGLWTDGEFLARVSELNDRTRHTRFADYHGHGWVFAAVFKRDRKGSLLDAEGAVVPFDAPDRFERAVHLRDVHLEAGMHCVDCHFSRDVHGDGTLQGEYSAAIEIDCEDCHGSAAERTDLRTSGPAAPPGGTDLALGTTPFGKRRFAWRAGTLVQRSMLDPEREWEVVQVRDTLDPAHRRYNRQAAWAKTVRRDGESWGAPPAAGADSGAGGGGPRLLTGSEALAHDRSVMSCYACHTSWMTSCFGCHLPQEANVRSPVQHYEGGVTRNYASYNPQVVRSDVFMLGRHGVFEGGRIAPVRSSSALVLSSTNQNRQRVYVQQPPISTPGFSSQAFNPHVPHTVRTKETRACTDCHLSEANDNNAWLAQVMTLGTGFVNFIGRFAWVGLGAGGLEAVAVTEWDEPQAVLGSHLHRLAYPRAHAEHLGRGGELEEAHHHRGPGRGGGEVRSLQLRGEYLFAAEGPAGLRVYDVANVDNKDFSERIVTAPVSPLGQDTRVPTAWATQVALPTTMPVAPGREVDPANLEAPLHPIYRYALVSDREEGLVLVDVATLTDRDPVNNFLARALAFNPDGALDGAESVTVAGTWVYVGCDRGLAVVDLSEPLAPALVATLPEVAAPRAIAVQLRYAFAAGPGGLSVVDVTDPRRPRLAARVPVADARSVYLARTYAYVAAGAEGLVIVDVERPEAPRIDRVYNAEGRLTDTWDVKVGSTGASLFAYVADGASGLHVLQLTSPETVPGYLGFSPRPEPRWIAGRHTHAPAVALSRGLDRDRAVDESGHQVSVFNRLGAGPLTREQMERLYLRDGEIYRVRDEPPGTGGAPPHPDPLPPAGGEGGASPTGGEGDASATGGGALAPGTGERVRVRGPGGDDGR